MRLDEKNTMVKSVLLYRGYIKSYFEKADSANFRTFQIQWLLLSNA